MSRTSQPTHVAQVLAGAGSYDSLSEEEQAIVRQEWAERTTHLRASLDHEARLAAAGKSYSETDEDGRLIVHTERV